MLPILQLGSLTLRTPGLALLAGLWFGLEIASREGSRRGLEENHVYNIGFMTLLGGVLGARLGFVLFNLPVYTSITPWTRAVLSVFALAPGTEIAGIGVLVAIGVIATFVRRWTIDPLTLADSFAPALAIFAAGIGLANLLSGDYYGVESRTLWAIDLWGARRHPTQVYFVLASLTIFVILWRMRLHDDRRDRPPGVAGQVFLIAFSLSMLLIEPLRADSPVIFGDVRLWMVIGLVGLLAGLASFAYRPPAASEDTE